MNQEQVRQWLEEQYGDTARIADEGEGMFSLCVEEWSRGSMVAYMLLASDFFDSDRAGSG